MDRDPTAGCRPREALPDTVWSKGTEAAAKTQPQIAAGGSLLRGAWLGCFSVLPLQNTGLVSYPSDTLLVRTLLSAEAVTRSCKTAQRPSSSKSHLVPSLSQDDSYDTNGDVSPHDSSPRPSRVLKHGVPEAKLTLYVKHISATGLRFTQADPKGGTHLLCLWTTVALAAEAHVWEHVGQHGASSLTTRSTSGRGEDLTMQFVQPSQ